MMNPIRKKPEAGSSTLLMVVIIAGILVLVSAAQWSRSNSKVQEQSVKAAMDNAQRSNVAAISYLHGSLQAPENAKPLLKIENNVIKGGGNSYLKLSDGGADFSQLRFSEADEAQVAQVFNGGSPAASDTMVKTHLKVLKTTKEFHTKIYDIEATTVPHAGSKTLAPVSSIGRIRILPANSSSSGISSFNTCAACEKGVAKLTSKLGYKSDIAKTRNFGFYKVDAATNLCDIHWLRNLSDEIEDHEGVVTSMLKTQVVVYCPCNCPWAG